jgi:phage-related protein
MSLAAKFEIGKLLRDVQDGYAVPMPHARPMPSIGPRCHELRVQDERVSWRVICRVDHDAVLVVDVFVKASSATPHRIIKASKQRLKMFDARQHGRE